MREEDTDRAALAVTLSLEQFLDAAIVQIDMLVENHDKSEFSPNSFNVCRINSIPNVNMIKADLYLLKDVIIKTPVPGLAQGLGDLPRFRAEVGTFVGFSPAIKGSMIFGGFGETENTVGLNGGIEVAARFGLGFDGVLNEAGDGLIFLELGWRQNGSSTTGIVD